MPRSKSGASKSRPRWAAHTRIGNVWEYPPRPRALTLPDGCAPAHSVKTFFAVAANNFAFITSRINPFKDDERIMTTQNSNA